MTEENERHNRERKVIPYDRAYSAPNEGLTYTDREDNEDRVRNDTEEADTRLNNPYPLGLSDVVTDEPEHVDNLDTTEPIKRDKRESGDILSGQEDIESAQEVAEPGPFIGGEDPVQQDDADDKASERNGWGITGLILSLVSIFIWPALLAPAGIIVGYIGFRSGARTTGIWAMVIGAFALLMAMFILPTYFR